MGSQKCYVDSATLWQVVQSLDLPDSEQYEWACNRLQLLTCLLLTNDHFYIVPGIRHSVSGRSAPIVAYDEFERALLRNNIMKPIEMLGAKEKKDSLTVAKQWAATHTKPIQESLETLKEDSSCLSRWLEWSASKAWPWHSQTLDGLFELDFMPYLSQILQLDEKDITELHRASCSPDKVQQMIRQRGTSFSLMAKAYIASAIIRGRYHMAVCKRKGQQHVKHPFRNMVSTTYQRQSSVLDVSKTITKLSEIIIDGARNQRGIENRLACWLGNLKLARKVTIPKPDLYHKEINNKQARIDASKIAREEGLTMANRSVVRIVELVAAMGLAGVLVSVKIDPWSGLIVTGGASEVLRRSGIVHKIGDRMGLLIHELKDQCGGSISGQFR